MSYELSFLTSNLLLLQVAGTSSKWRHAGIHKNKIDKKQISASGYDSDIVFTYIFCENIFTSDFL